MNAATVGKKVAILGGGIAGMSAAHELIERGFQVEVYERKSVPGGKARSTTGEVPTSNRYPFRAKSGADSGVARVGPGLPGEHGFRFFPRFYKHVIDTMARIPFGAGNVAGNLVETTQVHVARFDRPPVFLPARFPRGTEDARVSLFAGLAVLGGEFDLALHEIAFFGEKLWQIVTSCEERRAVEYERINWWDFIEAESRSAGYQTYFGNGATRSLVAAKAQRASTKTVGDIYAQIVFDLVQPGVSCDRLLTGPTNDVWIQPWLAYLKKQGVVYHLDAEVRAIHCDRGIVRSASVALGGQVRQIEADYFIAALPVERMAELVSPDLVQGDPSLANLKELTEYVEWMNGIQFYLTQDVATGHGHTTHIDTPWALTSISQPQFWTAYDLTNYGDGQVRGLLSVCISDWDVKGFNGKEAKDCSRAEIAKECWEQLKRSLNVGGQRLLHDEHLHSWFLDADITADPTTPNLEANAEPLLVNYVDTWRLRPEAVTRIPNLFLASDYVRTYTDLATMEAANEAARRAVNGVIRAARADVAPCQIWNLQEPEVFLPLRAYDRIRFRKGLSWDGQAVSLARAALNLTEQLPANGAAPRQQELIRTVQDSIRELLGGSLPISTGESATSPNLASNSSAPVRAEPTTSTTETAAAARASSDAGLRRLRIIG
jgi:uncharacterized protein with NAD-binding domain and iron-sulfur cluster